MTSLSLPAALPASFLTPFDTVPDRVAVPSPSAHTRRHSRNPNAAPLPSFSFNPGQLPLPSSEQKPEAVVLPEDPMPAQEPPRRAARPPRLPDFTFNPGADLVGAPEPSPTHPILEEMALNQHRNSRSSRPAPLPAFNFTGSSISSQPSPSPTKSTFGESAGSIRAAGGHRRHGSEFVGGGAEGSQLISTSPQKHDHRPSGPPSSGLPPRGHAHRRSQAVSISEIDTSDLIKANAVSKHRTGSTPTTPSDASRPQFFAHNSPQERQSISYIAKSLPSSPRRRGSAPGVRPRVGFSDHVDVIPRPLSLISSETEGSSSTIRGNHSVSGSINSIAASPTPRISMPPRAHSEESPRQRPQTSDCSLFSHRPLGMEDDLGPVNLPKRPLSASGSPVYTSNGSPPTKKKHFWFNHSGETSPNATPQFEKSDPISVLPAFAHNGSAEASRPKTSPERTASIKRRKVRSWTNVIFSRKVRHRSTKAKSKRVPTPPLLARQDSDQMNDVFDADDTIVIRDPSPVHQRPSTPPKPILVTDFSPVKYTEPTESITSPIIDLDAALGPFGSEEKFNVDFASRGAASRMAKLHSSERRGLTDAFGAFHRRAESAPQMPPVNRGQFSLHRLGSNTSLAEDVFDEEEEDNFLAGEQEAARSSMASSREPTEGDRSLVAMETEKGNPAKPSQTKATSTIVEGLGLSLAQPKDAVVILDSVEGVGLDATRASNSTIEAPILLEADIPKRPASSPMDLAYHVPQSHYASSTEGRTATNSLISSPDADHISFDNQPRFGRYMSEPSPDVGLRVSTDDLPSLTDSLSTGNVPRFSSSANTRSSIEQRSASLSGAVVSKPSNAWKRASLASLNRLIPGSANGSRLKFETTPDPTEDEKSRKKANRLSKLIYFWRSKEKIAT